ncbi:VOC family protein [Telmatospirillum sp. J64-1]|uniref:bleomycin resistance protein n=1 Tax=Telmatospirillum sp. J64-1 TaxID=2502183 RepID=UPI00115EB076|nr:VOC family protein [Telmatospirillum sp. J64-1]
MLGRKRLKDVVPTVDGKAIPILAAFDLDETVGFYRCLGFGLQARYDDYAVLARGQIELHFWVPEGQVSADGAGCYLRVNDVTALYYEVLASGLTSVGRLEDKPWGMREFHISDPSGNLLRIGQQIR